MTGPNDPTPQGSPRQPIDPTGTSAPPPPPPGYVPAVYVQHPAGGKSGTKIALYLLAVGLLVSVTLNVYLFGPVAAVLHALSMSGPTEQDYYPTFEPTGNDQRIVVVEIAGTIDDPTADFAVDTFYMLDKDPPAAVILRVESGGGGVTASDQIWHAITTFKTNNPDVPVIASFGIAAASGGYYISAPCDYIFCERTTMTGSIGVYAQIPGLGRLVEMLGVEMNMVIATDSPEKDDANNLFISWYDDEGNLTEEGAQSYAVVENLVNNSYDIFRDVVVTGRGAADPTITEEALADAMTGKVFYGEEAVDARLVDKIGYLDDAIAYAASEAGLDSDDLKVRVLREEPPGLLSRASASHDAIDLTNLTGEELNNFVDDSMSIRLQYRMRPR